MTLPCFVSSVLVVIESYGFPSCGIYRNRPLDLLLAQSEMLKMYRTVKIEGKCSKEEAFGQIDKRL